MKRNAISLKSLSIEKNAKTTPTPCMKHNQKSANVSELLHSTDTQEHQCTC